MVARPAAGERRARGGFGSRSARPPCRRAAAVTVRSAARPCPAPPSRSITWCSPTAWPRCPCLSRWRKAARRAPGYAAQPRSRRPRRSVQRGASSLLDGRADCVAEDHRRGRACPRRRCSSSPTQREGAAGAAARQPAAADGGACAPHRRAPARLASYPAMQARRTRPPSPASAPASPLASGAGRGFGPPSCCGAMASRSRRLLLWLDGSVVRRHRLDRDGA